MMNYEVEWMQEVILSCHYDVCIFLCIMLLVPGPSDPNGRAVPAYRYINQLRNAP